jgi:exonuclease I
MARMSDLGDPQVDADLRAMRKASIEASRRIDREKIQRLRSALADARDKLRRYRARHFGEYLGGVEYYTRHPEIVERTEASFQIFGCDRYYEPCHDVEAELQLLL